MGGEAPSLAARHRRPRERRNRGRFFLRRPIAMPHHLRAALRGPLALAFLSGALLAACGGVRTAPAHPTTSPVAAAPAVVEKPSTYVVIRVKARRLELMQ